MNDTPRQGWPQPDTTGHLPGQVGSGLAEPHFALDLYEVATLFDAAGIARNRRSLSRYCMAGKLDCQKVETLNGEEWRIDEQSVHRLIAQTLEQQRLTRQDISERPTASLRQDRPGQVEASPMADGNASLPPAAQNSALTVPDTTGDDRDGNHSDVAADEPRQIATQPDRPSQATSDDRLIKQLERENDLLRDQLLKKDAQIDKKDKQIDDLIERGREDKLLLQNFQRKLGMLDVPKGERYRENDDGDFDQPPRDPFFADAPRNPLSTPDQP